MAINHWPEAERPRERLLAQGPGALSDAELLAIFLRTGVKGQSAVDLARTLIHDFGGLRPLLAATQNQFCQQKGLGKAKFAQLQAVLEMAKRHLSEQMLKTDVFTSAENTRSYLRLKMRDLAHEEFRILFLDSQHQLLADETLFRGTLDGASVYPREVIKQVLKHNAAAVILAHNHPSGIAEPSDADIQITRRLKRALELLDIRVLDHQVVGDTEVVSMAERGLM